MSGSSLMPLFFNIANNQPPECRAGPDLTSWTLSTIQDGFVRHLHCSSRDASNRSTVRLTPNPNEAARFAKTMSSAAQLHEARCVSQMHLQEKHKSPANRYSQG